MTIDQDKLQGRVNAELDESVTSLDELTKAKLQAARNIALAKAQQKPWWQKLNLQQGLVATSFSLLAVALIVQQQMPEQGADEQALMAMLEPTLQEEPEMLSELEFLVWLEQEQLLQAEGTEQSS